MRIIMTLFILLSFLSIQSFAATPGGSYSSEAQDSPVEDGKWDPKWSEAFQSQFNGTWGLKGEAQFQNILKKKNAEALQSILEAAKGSNEFCGDKINTAAGAQLFALAIAKAMCVPESGCNQQAENPGAPNGSALGLFQIGLEDAKRHNCTMENGIVPKTEEQMKDGAVNAACMAKIMINCATGLEGKQPKHKGKIADGNNGQYGFVGCFWEPIRKGKREANTGGASGEKAGGSVDRDAKRAKIADFTKKACEAMSQGTQQAAQEIFTEQEVQMALNNNVPNQLQNQPGIYSRGNGVAI